MKYLFIGGTGNISKYITRDLLAAGHTVYLVNRGFRNDGLTGDVHFIRADVNKEPEKLAEAISDMTFDAVADFIVFNKEQAERDFNLFNGKCRQYLVFSTASVYQKPLSCPVITESTPLSNPYSPYSKNKIEMEAYLNEMYRQHGFPVTIIRPSHTYGDHFLPLTLECAEGGWPTIKRILEGKPVIVHGDGLTLWTVTHSSDFAKGFIGLLNNIHAIGETYHITSDECVTWNQIFEVMGEACGKKPILYHVASELLGDFSDGKYLWGTIGDKGNSVIFDNSKLKRVVPGFTCTVRMDQGVKESVEYLLAHPEMQKENPEFDAWCDKVIDTLEEAKKRFHEA